MSLHTQASADASEYKAGMDKLAEQTAVQEAQLQKVNRQCIQDMHLGGIGMHVDAFAALCGCVSHEVSGACAAQQLLQCKPKCFHSHCCLALYHPHKPQVYLPSLLIMAGDSGRCASKAGI